MTPALWRASPTGGHLVWLDERFRSFIPSVGYIEIEDVSDGHTAVGFSDGSGRSVNPDGLELRLTIVSPAFDGLTLIERHRLVTAALEQELASGAVHSLPSLRTLTPAQWLSSCAKEMESKLARPAVEATFAAAKLQVAEAGAEVDDDGAFEGEELVYRAPDGCGSCGAGGA